MSKAYPYTRSCAIHQVSDFWCCKRATIGSLFRWGCDWTPG